MTRAFVSLRRISALSVAITLFAAPIASAQSPEAAPPNSAQANTALLSPAAFARLSHVQQTDIAPVPALAQAPRPSLLRQATTAMARQAQAAPTSAPQQKSWASRHKLALGLLIGLGVVIGVMVGVSSMTCTNSCFE